MSEHEICVHVSQCKHIKAIVTICRPFPLIPYLRWWWSTALGFGLTCDVCYALLLRNTSPRSDWGQRLLNGAFFFHLRSSHRFVSLWLWASSHCTAGSRHYIRFNSGSRLGEKPDLALADFVNALCKCTFRAPDSKISLFLLGPKSLNKEGRKSEGMCEHLSLSHTHARALECAALLGLWSTTKSHHKMSSSAGSPNNFTHQRRLFTARD